ncbi:uncharacterized protein [Dermacentor albipictus]|uniref:uncharacterized protein isoform X2 n=1 Tax=Dermacentor albipictus TaxID=60249 RepID=UPI0031FDD7BC
MLAEEAHASGNLKPLRALLSRFCASSFSSKTCSYMDLCQFYMMNYGGKRMVVRRSCPCEVGDYSRTCPTVGRAGAREAMTVIRKQYRASSCRHRRSRGRKRKATLDKMSHLDEVRNYSPSTTPAPHRQPVKSIILKEEHSPCRRCFEDAAKPRGYDDMKAMFPSEATSEPPRGRRYVDTVSATVVDFPEPPSNSDLENNSVWVDALFKELFWVLKLHGLPFSGSGHGGQSSAGGIKKRRRLLLERAAAFACPAVCAAYAVHCMASLYLALKRDQDTIMAVVPDVSDLCRALVSSLTAVHGALNGARVSALLRHSAAAMFGRQPSTSVHLAKPSKWSAMRRIVMASSGFALLSWVVFVGLRISTLRRRGPREYCVSYLYGFDPYGGDGGPAVYVVPALDALLYGAIMAVPRWSIALHVSLCLFLGAMAEQLSDSVRQAAEPQERQLAAAEVRRHGAVLHLRRALDHVARRRGRARRVRRGLHRRHPGRRPPRGPVSCGLGARTLGEGLADASRAAPCMLRPPRGRLCVPHAGRGDGPESGAADAVHGRARSTSGDVGLELLRRTPRQHHHRHVYAGHVCGARLPDAAPHRVRPPASKAKK